MFARQDLDAIALAHHLDDQAETVALQLLRGAGAPGLAAMPETRSLPGSKVLAVRPLLEIPRAQVEDYARRKGWTLAEAERWLAPNLAYQPD